MLNLVTHFLAVQSESRIYELDKEEEPIEQVCIPVPPACWPSVFWERGDVHPCRVGIHPEGDCIHPLDAPPWMHTLWMPPTPAPLHCGMDALPVNRQTRVKTLPSRNFVCGQ